MDEARFDRVARTLAGAATRRSALTGALSGLVLLLPTALAEGRKRRNAKAVAVEKQKKKKKCQPGLLTCTIKKGKHKKKKRFCVDAQTDPLNCGGCDVICANSQTCQRGACTCNGALCAGCCDGVTCQAGTSNQQCGANGAICQICSGGRSCQNGVCTCPAGQTFCGGTCVDTRTDPANCGSCGTTCSSPWTCGGNGAPGVCGCTPTTCEAQGKSCGPIPDGCGETLNCGTCEGATPVCSGGTVCVACSLTDPCPDGCCAADGTCRSGTQFGACGPVGGTCIACTPDTRCSFAGACVQAFHNFNCKCTNGANEIHCTQLACNDDNVTEFCGAICTAEGDVLDAASTCSTAICAVGV